MLKYLRMKCLVSAIFKEKEKLKETELRSPANSQDQSVRCASDLPGK